MLSFAFPYLPVCVSSLADSRADHLRQLGKPVPEPNTAKEGVKYADEDLDEQAKPSDLSDRQKRLEDNAVFDLLYKAPCLRLAVVLRALTVVLCGRSLLVRSRSL